MKLQRHDAVDFCDGEVCLSVDVAKLEDELDKHRWRKVEDELPEEQQTVIYYFETTGVDIGKYWKGEHGMNCFGGNNRGWLCEDVTHWKPITPPEQDSK